MEARPLQCRGWIPDLVCRGARVGGPSEGRACGPAERSPSSAVGARVGGPPRGVRAAPADGPSPASRSGGATSPGFPSLPREGAGARALTEEQCRGARAGTACREPEGGSAQIARLPLGVARPSDGASLEGEPSAGNARLGWPAGPRRWRQHAPEALSERRRRVRPRHVQLNHEHASAGREQSWAQCRVPRAAPRPECAGRAARAVRGASATAG